MEAFIVITIILLVTFALAFRYRHRAPALDSPTNSRPPLPEWSGPRGLFDDPTEQAALAQAEAEEAAAAERAALFARANAGDEAVLAEAFAINGLALYRELLDVLAIRAQSDEETLRALVRHIVQNGQWRASVGLVEALLLRWQTTPERYTLGELLHLAALSDDAALFQRVTQATLAAWRAGRLNWASPNNLRALIESEYWMLAPEARQAGDGFVLKRMLVEVRRELAAATQPASS